MINRACISINESCNLSCKYCHFSKRKTYLSQTFNYDEVKTIIDNIDLYCRKNNVFEFKIGIVGAGEPLLSFDVIEYLVKYSKTKKSNISFYTITNGSLITKDHLMFFYNERYKISLNFSLDGYEELHNFGRDKFSETFENIILYKKLFNEMPSINCTIHKQSILNEDKLLSWFLERGFKQITFSRLVDVREEEFLVTKNEFNDFLEFAKKYPFSIRQASGNKKYDCTMYGSLCGVGKNNIFFTKRGVLPCGRFYGNKSYSLGNYYDGIEKIEQQMKSYRCIENGDCYYDKYLLEAIK